MNQSLVLTDPSIIQYFSENPQIDPNTLVVLFIDILKQLSTNMTASIQNANITQILSRISELNTSVESIRTDVTSTMRDQSNKFESIRTDVTSTIRDQSNKVENIILKDRETIGGMLADKTANAVSSANTNIKSVMEEANSKHKANLYNLQQELKQLVAGIDDRTQRDIRTMSDQISHQCRSQEALTVEMSGFLNKYKNNSSVKGNVSEKELYNILQRVFPTDELVVCSKTTASCDICVNRSDPAWPSILFENKDYSVSVDKEEIKKFERDLHVQKKHGVFISQNSPITFKGNFHIDIIDGLIHVYIPNANYDIDRIKVAVDIIDNLSIKLLANASVGDVKISNTELSEILYEYKNFATRKVRLLDGLKTNTKIWIEEIEAMTLPRIQTLLIHTGNLEKCELTCGHCLTFTGKNKASLSAHIKSCKHASTPVK